MATGLAQLRADHATLYRGAGRGHSGEQRDLETLNLVGAAAASGDPHQVKLVEACRRGLRMRPAIRFSALRPGP